MKTLKSKVASEDIHLEDYESESCPELDKSPLLVAQVKLPCVFEI